MKDWSLKTKSIFIGAIAADSDAFLWGLWKVPTGTKIRIAGAKLCAASNAAAVDTNYNTLTIQEASTVIATLAKGPAAGGIGLTLGVFADMTLTAANLEWAAGDEFVLKVTKTGTGQALVGLQVQIDYYDING